MIRKILFCACLALVLGGCVSYDGGDLVAGASTTAQVEERMGPPAMRLPQADGSNVLFYPRGPEGRHTFAITVGAEGRVRSIDQRLTLANFNKLSVGKTTSREVRELFGPADPYAMSKLALSKREVWEYKWLDYQEKRVFWFQFSEDGILRETINSRDDFHESPGTAMP